MAKAWAKKKAVVAEVPAPEAAPLFCYKGFDSQLRCHGYRYEIGQTYEHKGPVVPCESGFHACESPLDVWSYYGPGNSRFAQVELSGEVQRHSDDSKIASAKITIKAELSLPAFIGKCVDFMIAQVDWANAKETNTGDRSAATNTGYRSAATNTGDQSAATNTGDQSAATNTGDRSAATNTGDRSAATNTGNWSAATNTGDRSAATNTGYRSAATNTGNWSAATNTGYRSAATNTGDQSAATNTGKDGVALASGYEGRVSGALGCALFLVERADNYRILSAWAGIVGRDGIEPDVFYTLKDGKPVRAA